MTQVEYVDCCPPNWFVLDVMREKSRSRVWVALMIDVHPDDMQALYREGRRARECWVRIHGKHRDRDAAWDALQDTLATRH